MLKKYNKYVLCSNGAFKRSIAFSQGKIKKYQKKCLAGKMYCAVNPNGRIAPCWVHLNKVGYENELSYERSFGLSNLNCDCDIHCFYNLNQALSLNPLTIINNLFNFIRKKRVY